MTSAPSLDSRLAIRAKDATVDISPILACANRAELVKVGGGMILEAQGNANIAAVQLAMRNRAAELAIALPLSQANAMG